MDSFLMATMPKPAPPISERMAAVELLRTASGLIMLNVRWATRNLLLEWEFLSLFIVEAAPRRPPLPRSCARCSIFHSPDARYFSRGSWLQSHDFRHVTKEEKHPDPPKVTYGNHRLDQGYITQKAYLNAHFGAY